MTEPKGPESSAAAPGSGERRTPRWAALISTIVIAALVGGLVGVGVTLGVQRLTTQPAQHTSGQPSTTQVTITQTSAISQVVSQATPAVVSVLAAPGAATATSGFLVSSSGYVVTNVAAVADATQLSVLLPNDPKVQAARPVAEDCATGLAILQVTGVQNLPTLSLATSSTLSAGQTVVLLAGASPYQSMATQALISGVGRSGSLVNPTDQQTQQVDGTALVDQQFGSAWSGGPVLNLGGQVVGMLVHGQTDFVVSGAALQAEVQTFLASGQLEVPSLGVTTTYVDPVQAAAESVVSGDHVTAVTPSGPAAEAGVQVGDVITAVQNQQLSPTSPLDVVLRQDVKAQQKVTVTLQRAGAQRQVQLTLTQEVPSC